MKPSRYDIIVMPTAEADLAEMLGTIGEHSPANAVSAADEIIRRIESLGRFPRRGARAREGAAFGLDLRQIVVLSHRFCTVCGARPCSFSESGTARGFG